MLQRTWKTLGTKQPGGSCIYFGSVSVRENQPVPTLRFCYSAHGKPLLLFVLSPHTCVHTLEHQL